MRLYTILAFFLPLAVSLGTYRSCFGFEDELFPGTTRWENRVDPSKAMVDGLHRYLDRMTADSVAQRAAHWKRDTSSAAAYSASIGPQRDLLRKIIGAEAKLATPVKLEVVADWEANRRPNNLETWHAQAVRWSVYGDFQAEGLLLEPHGTAVGSVVALPDCDITAEQFAGLADGLHRDSQIARLFVERGFRVLIPTLLSRSDEHSGSPTVRMTNLSHREWIYRQAYETGRHIIGYEVDEVRAGVEWLKGTQEANRPVVVVGQGEGGGIALHAAALDPRIDAAWVGGYFSPREQVWHEPIDRNVWAFLTTFGAAELASMVSPRPLLIEACQGPEVKGPRPARNGRADAASGTLTTPRPGDVDREFKRFQALIQGLADAKAQLLVSGEGQGRPNQDNAAIEAFLKLVGAADSRTALSGKLPAVASDPKAREFRVLKGMIAHTQQLIRTSELRRDAYWSKADRTSVARWTETSRPYREAFIKELMGDFPAPTLPMNPKSVKILDEPKWTGYAIQLDLHPDVVASGVLLWPKDMKPGEKRPVVVCQHGLEGTTDPIVDRKIKSVYNSYGAQLADRGYIVYAPQNPYIGVDHFRQLQRKANPLKQSLFSIIIRQHERTLAWLSGIEGVDPKRIAFYGLSYGGKTAMRVPAALTNYCLSICSADFNEWVVKMTNLDRQYSYLFTIEYDMYEFGLAEQANYAEMASLISPRPFMVERGHKDGVAPDEWIGYEFAKVRRHYDFLGVGDRAEIAYFNEGHQIDGKGSFAFLAKHLNWPRGTTAP